MTTIILILLGLLTVVACRPYLIAYIRRRVLFVLAPRLRHALIAPANITRDA